MLGKLEININKYEKYEIWFFFNRDPVKNIFSIQY